MNKKLYRHLAGKVQAMATCRKTDNAEWFERHSDAAEKLCKDHMPSGSGVDCGTTIDLDRSKPQRLVFHTSFHHMDESGGYDGWTEHDVIVTPCLYSGFDLRITGRDRDDIKDYLGELFSYALDREIEA